MADLLVTATGRKFYEVDPTLAAILCEALPTVFERVAAPPAKALNAPNAEYAPVPVFTVGIGRFSQTPNITYRHQNTTEFFDGTPEQAKGWRAACPDSVVEQYRALIQKRRREDNTRVGRPGVAY